jgi:outer membrane protein TolC
MNPSRLPSCRRCATAAALCLPALAAAARLSVEDAIRAAWRSNPGIAASAAQVEASRADAEAARDAIFPSLTLTARGVGTNEPVQAFGLKLDQGRITPADFDPAILNSPAFTGGFGGGAAIMQPVYSGGRITAGRAMAAAQADAEGASHERRSQELAAAVVETYFGAEVAAEGVRFAEDALDHARETERFVRARNAKGLALDADVARAAAARAQAEAARATALQRLASARSGLRLLVGAAAVDADLVTPVYVERPLPPAEGATLPERPDLRAARLRRDAAESGITIARGSLIPEVFAQGSVETSRYNFEQGRTFFNVALVARWQLGLSELRRVRAASARAQAADDALRWQELQSQREVDEARRAAETADSHIASAREAVTASEAARSLRISRHREGLLPLTDVLDAEAALTGARTLLLQSQLEARVARARVELALGQPVEGVRP